MKLRYLLLLLVLASCVHKAENQESKSDKATDSDSAFVSRVAVNDSVEFSGSLSLDDIENLHITISNGSGRNIYINDKYEIMVFDGQQWELLFDKAIDSPMLMKPGEKKEVKINLRLEEFKYSKKSQYQVRAYFRAENDGQFQYELSCPFKTADMWKNGKSLVIVPDTIINH